MTDSNPATHRPPAKSLSDQYGKRLDLYLPTLQSDFARLTYLRAQYKSWDYQHRLFIATGGDRGRRDPEFGWPSVHDYYFTVCEIEKRIAQYEPAKEVA